MSTHTRLLAVSTPVCILIAIFVRLYALGSLPPAPYWEEVAVAYDAYSILQTGRDHHGDFLPLVALESFGDWKPAGYAYAQIPSIALFGLTTVALRLPAALAGVALVLFCGFLSWKLSDSTLVGVFGLFISALSPWQIMFSRGGWEVMLATALFCWGAALLVLSYQSSGRYSLVQSLFGSLLLWASVYTYHAMRILVPAMLVSLGVYLLLQTAHKGYIAAVLNKLWIPVLISIICVLPLLLAWGTPKLSQRFSETSIFSDITIIEQSNAEISQAQRSFAARIFSHRYVLFGRVILDQYASHFSPAFLFVSGDNNPRHATGFGGQLYILDSVILLFGILALLSNKKYSQLHPWLWLLISIVILSPLPASITKAAPHALRTLPLAVAFVTVAALGVGNIVRLLRVRNTSLYAFYLVVLFGVYLVQPVAWWRHYTTVYAVEAASEWQYGYAELVSTLQQLEQDYPELPIYVSRELGRPAMYLWFYTKSNPLDVQSLDASAAQDQGEYVEFGRYRFVRGVSEIPNVEAIVAVPASNEPTDTVLRTIFSPSDEAVWHVLYRATK